MAKLIGPAKTKQYSLEFKLKAVHLSHQPGVLVKDVAESLCIYPFMLSKWRRQVRLHLATSTCSRHMSMSVSSVALSCPTLPACSKVRAASCATSS